MNVMLDVFEYTTRGIRRSMMARLRGGTAELAIEVGRWHGVRREGT